MITRRGLIRTAGIAAPALLLRPAMAQFDSCLPGICGGNVAAPAFATLNDTPVNVTLSGGNLTATHNAAPAGGARTTSFKLSSALYYFEVTLTTVNTAGTLTGVAILRDTGTYADITGAAANNTALFFGNGAGVPFGEIFANSGDTTKTLGALSNGNVIGVAVKLGATPLVWFRKAPAGNWNGDAAANPATTTGGVTLSGATNSNANACGPAIGYAGTGEVFTANFGASAFVGTVPSGFQAGWLL